MELRHLRYFIAVADELSFSRAAERLQIAQPPLSQQIQALEAELGVKLFDRRKRPLQLTSAGEAFVEEARSTMVHLEQVVQKTQRIHQGTLGYLTVSFTSSIANGILPDILWSFRQRYPEVKLILREENSAFQLQGLRDRKTDILFAYRYNEIPNVSDLEVMPLKQEPLVVVLPKKHPLANRSKISFSDLSDEEFIIPLSQIVIGLPEKFYYLCSQTNFVPKVAQEAVFMVTILGLVAAEIGISILPSSAQNLRRKGVVYRPILEQTTTIQLAAVWRQNNSSTILQQFLKVIKTVSAIDSE
jgi:DNA-binding transcriptional LysR family regulator